MNKKENSHNKELPEVLILESMKTLKNIELKISKCLKQIIMIVLGLSVLGGLELNQIEAILKILK